MTIADIQRILPHRYPFLLVDKIIECDWGVRAVGQKNVSINEPFFAGHFPGHPVMPGVLIMEALAQVGAVSILGVEENRGKIGFLTGLDRVRIRGQVKPGDILRLEVEMLKMRRYIGKAKGTATVEGKVVAEGELMFAIGEAE
ncbi:3-hydroxyacyl-ACP dehydratase FabZ [Mechercharimyces sp. CAU 1602]|uniref:3-hydroxyacyl-ACP dehydratase FabZ n=1 Tax=Mechercharimyces sp. CAU 1602 TaxID=2973933 RepID=UPI002163215D|nr:3-hydroxyacyl-ACP dehydratase FabZ [Mechercharimyces sp. CAU 1602]MCS1352258.1 3-hydroxyacyl-ACP dehydratase FabZ [Mechercharimyces sp. CAU 1602]